MAPITELNLLGQPVAPLAIIATPGADSFAKLIDKRLVEMFKGTENAPQNGKDTYIIDTLYPRFTSGDGKALITDTVRG